MRSWTSPIGVYDKIIAVSLIESNESSSDEVEVGAPAWGVIREYDQKMHSA